MQHIELTITGMTCDHCVRAVTNALAGQAGTTVEEVAIGTVRAAYDPARVTPQQLMDAIEEEGYEVTSREVHP